MKQSNFEKLVEDKAAKRAVVLATNLATGEDRLIYPETDDDPLIEAARTALRDDKPQSVETPQGSVFLNPFNPPLRLVIVGAVHIAQPLAQMASLSGYAVTIVDPRTAFATQERFPNVEVVTEWPDDALKSLSLDHRTAVVTLTHDPKLDDPALEVAIKSPCFYIGSLGSKKTHASRIERLTEAGFSGDERNRIHGPVGLAINAKSPSEIAVSVLAQITSVLRQANAP